MSLQVTMAANAEQALLMLDTRPPFDLLLTDVALGFGLRGTELAARAQQRFPSMPILLMSGFSPELLGAGRDSPLRWELLRKPCTRQELANAIAKVLAASRAA